MTTVLTVFAAMVAVVAAARSTWSPCGVSMLATITPLAEAGRGHRYRSTALWFVAGALVGGITLGLVLALLAVACRRRRPHAATLALLACLAAATAAASDARLGGFALPVHHRQVNERWLDQFRPWVYGAGFGWQIGAGVVTYIKTAGVYLLAALAVLTGSWWAALGRSARCSDWCGVSRCTSGGASRARPALAAFHRGFTRLGPVVLAVVVSSECAAAVLFGWLLSPGPVRSCCWRSGAVLGTRAARRRARGPRDCGTRGRARRIDGPA